jgi:photosystem II stability/assembly factor-like uncharacterized protein
MVIAGIALQGLWSMTNGASSWAQLGTGPGSAAITNRTSSVLYDPDHPDTFWESGIYNAGGVYVTTDNGQTFTQLGTTTHNDRISVDLTDPARKTMLAGGHEQTSQLNRSTDGGSTWTNVGVNIPASAGFTTLPQVIDSMVHLVGTYNGTGSGIFRTTNGGSSWTQVFSTGVRQEPLVASDGTIYWLVDGNGGLVASSDKGQTWKMVTTGMLYSYGSGSILELPDGRLVSYGTQNLMISKDKAATWTAIGPAFPYTPVGVTYSTFRKAFYIWHFDCQFTSNDPVLPDAILSYPFDYQTQ